METSQSREPWNKGKLNQICHSTEQSSAAAKAEDLMVTNHLANSSNVSAAILGEQQVYRGLKNWR